jgi:hypothetical protein
MAARERADLIEGVSCGRVDHGESAERSSKLGAVWVRFDRDRAGVADGGVHECAEADRAGTGHEDGVEAVDVHSLHRAEGRPKRTAGERGLNERHVVGDGKQQPVWLDHELAVGRCARLGPGFVDHVTLVAAMNMVAGKAERAAAAAVLRHDDDAITLAHARGPGGVDDDSGRLVAECLCGLAVAVLPPFGAGWRDEYLHLDDVPRCVRFGAVDDGGAARPGDRGDFHAGSSPSAPALLMPTRCWAGALSKAIVRRADRRAVTLINTARRSLTLLLSCAARPLVL